MHLLALTLALASGLPEGPMAAARDCPPVWQDRPLRCVRGYVAFAPAGLLIPLGDVRGNEFADGPRLGYSATLGAGIFRVSGRLGVAVGGRFNYTFTRQRYSNFDSLYKYLHVGPELRLGGVGRRVFAFGLLRAGYSRWSKDYAQRLSIEQSEWSGGHVGVGLGAWGRLGARTFVGGEAALDVLFEERLEGRPLTLSVVLGLWL